MKKVPGPSGSKVTKMDASDGRSAVLIVRAGEDEAESASSTLDATGEMFYVAQRERVVRAGLAHLPEAEALLRQQQQRYRRELEREVRGEPIAAGLLQLFDAPTKREAIQVARKLTITQTDFANLVINARWTLGYRHRQKIREFRPDHHEAFSRDVSRALGSITGPGPVSAEVAKDLRKIDALRLEEKRVVAHMFSKGAKWHCFFFDFSDILGEHHAGPHLHYLSHRWTSPGLTRESVWAAFDNRRNSLPRGQHITYLDTRVDRSTRGRRFWMKGTPHVLRVDRPGDVERPDGKIESPASDSDTDGG